MSGARWGSASLILFLFSSECTEIDQGRVVPNSATSLWGFSLCSESFWAPWKSKWLVLVLRQRDVRDANKYGSSVVVAGIGDLAAAI